MSENKTEDPTPKKQREARQDGNVPKSNEFTGVFVMISAIGVLIFWLSAIVEQLAAAVRHAIALASRPDLGPSLLGPYLLDALGRVSWILFPLLATTFVMAAFISFVQTGPLFTPKVLMPKGNKLNPINGFKQMFSKKKGVELLKNLLKIGVMGGIGFTVLHSNIPTVLKLTRLELVGGLSALQAIALDLGAYLVGGLVAFGIFDLWYTRKKWWDDLKMSKKDVEDERKAQEGDPEVEGKRKEKHKEILNEAGSGEKVKDADAVVANPTHVAVALQYDDAEMEAPHIVASGRGNRAQKIKRIARRHDVPVLRDVTLARSLFDCEVDRAIPPDFYEPVAEVLCLVYELDASDS